MEAIPTEKAQRPAAAGARPWGPAAKYDAIRDRIIVKGRVSEHEEIVPDSHVPIIVFKDKYEGPAGFAVTRALAFCLDNGLIHNGSVEIGELLSVIAAAFPNMEDTCTVLTEFLVRYGINVVQMYTGRTEA